MAEIPTRDTVLSRMQIAINKTQAFFSKPYRVIGILIILPIAFLVIMPALELIRTSITRDGSYTLYYWHRILVGPLSNALFYKPLLNTLKVAFGMTAGSILIGGGLAWLVVRTDLPLHRLVERLSIVPYIIPSWVISLAWLTTFRNSESGFGGFNGILQSLFGFKSPVWLIYGIFPIIVTLTIHYFPYTFILVANALRTVDTHLEETGEVLGASRPRILRKITFPIVLPAILSALILTLTKGLGTFGVPAFLGPPVNFRVLPTVVYFMINMGSYGEAYAIAIISTLIAVLTIFMNIRLISARRSFTTISGKGVRIKAYRLGKWKWPLFIIVAVVIIASAILPLAILFVQSIMLYPGDFSISNITSHFWFGGLRTELGDYGEPGVFRNSVTLSAAWNSIKLSLVSATITAFAGILIGYVVVKGKGKFLSKATDQVSFLPYLMPGMPFALIYLVMFARQRGPIPALYGTMALLVLITVVKRLPFSSRTGISSMTQIGKELDESAFILGAGWFRRFRKIMIPLTLDGFVGGFLLAFVTVMRELSLVILLVTPKTQLLTTLIFRYAEENIPQFTNALALLIVFITGIVYLLVSLLQKRNRFGGPSL